MLLPEPNRSSVPYIVSVTVQCSLVLLLAIPWTVQRLRTNGSIEIPTLLTFQNLKPVEVVKAASRDNESMSSLPLLPRMSRIFVPSLPHSSASGPAVIDQPLVDFGSGGTGLIAVPMPPSAGVITNLFPAPLPPAPIPTSGDPKTQIIVGGVVQAAKLIHRVQPVYPALARQIRVQGVVVLDANIAADGTIQQLRVLSGHPMLVTSAVDAVRQWVYSPTILNGKPVEVKTTIDVRFTLSGN